MNSKKVIRATINYADLFNRCPPEQLRNLKIFQEKHKQYVEQLNALPEEPPKINWEFYKQNVRSEYVSMVEEFEKRYNELKIPYPEDPYTSQIEEMKNKVSEEVCAYIAESNKRIENYEAEISTICNTIPFEEMTIEEYCILYPEVAPDFINRPTFWPHTPEEQLVNGMQPFEAEKIQKEKEEAEKQTSKKLKQLPEDKNENKKSETKKKEELKTEDVSDKKSTKTEDTKKDTAENKPSES